MSVLLVSKITIVMNTSNWIFCSFDCLSLFICQVTVVPDEGSGESPEPHHKDKEKAEKENMEEGW